jgi:hypothetical protein
MLNSMLAHLELLPKKALDLNLRNAFFRKADFNLFHRPVTADVRFTTQDMVDVPFCEVASPRYFLGRKPMLFKENSPFIRLICIPGGHWLSTIVSIEIS